MGTIVAGLAATAFTVGSTSVTYGGLLTIAALGATTATALDQPKIQQPKAITNIADKTTPQQAEQLDPAVLGGDSEKRKRQSAKSKFKINKDQALGTDDISGVSFDSSKITGVQI